MNLEILIGQDDAYQASIRVEYEEGAEYEAEKEVDQETSAVV